MTSKQIDVTTHDAFGHWDYEDIVRLCAYRDRLRAALERIDKILEKPEWYDDGLIDGLLDDLGTITQEALGPAVETTAECPHCREVYEIWAGSDGMVPETAPEAYQERLINQMRDAAKRGLAVNGNEGTP